MAISAKLNHNGQFSKTKLCRFELLGMCTKGPSCPFAHDTMELRSLPDLRGSKLCKQYVSTGSCMIPSCTYAHSKAELKQSLDRLASSDCSAAAAANAAAASTAVAAAASALPAAAPQTSSGRKGARSDQKAAKTEEFSQPQWCFEQFGQIEQFDSPSLSCPPFPASPFSFETLTSPPLRSPPKSGLPWPPGLEGPFASSPFDPAWSQANSDEPAYVSVGSPFSSTVLQPNLAIGGKIQEDAKLSNELNILRSIWSANTSLEALDSMSEGSGSGHSSMNDNAWGFQAPLASSLWADRKWH